MKSSASTNSSSSANDALIAFFEDRLAAPGAPAAWRFEDPVDCLTVHGAADLATVSAALADNDCWVVLAIDYELGYLLEPKSAPTGWQPPPDRPLARFWRFRRRQALTAAEMEAWLAPVQALAAGIGGLQPGLDQARYFSTVDRIKRYIAEGDCYQVNLTFPLHFATFGPPLALYARLRARQPVRYGGFLSDGSGALLSLSPELFFARQGTRLLTRPMKGTAPRDSDPQALAASEKDRAENLMIVDLLRNDLGRLAEPGTVRVERLFDIEGYPTVWQMVSEISAQVPGHDWLTLLSALFPCGSITGAPKIRAMQVIGELETAPRGVYTGAFGWLAPTGDASLNVAIRTLEIDRDGVGRLGVGSGIVADSRAEAEWQECLLKGAFLTQADPGLRLIETLRREAGVYPHRAGHLARLRQSAAWFGFPFEAARIEAALDAQPAQGLWRVRLTLGADGVPEVTAVPLTEPPVPPVWAEWSPVPICSTDPLRVHKTTERALYDAALRDCQPHPEVFDRIFLNERGEVAEGARSTVFVERDGRLLTPPLASGALPGVLRAALLASGQAIEQVLYPADLADGCLLGNALRGLQRVFLRSTVKKGDFPA